MQISTVKFSEVKEEVSNLFRLDAEYWQSPFLKNNNLISDKCRIKDFVENNILNIKSFPIDRDFEYLNISNIDLDNYQYQTNTINEGEEPDRATYILQKKDIVVSVSTVRPIRNAVAFITDDGIIGSSGVSVLRAKNIEPEYLAVFCKTDYFITCLIRANKATMYPAVSDNDILNTSIFIPSCEFNKIIIELFNSAYRYNQLSKELYHQTESILRNEIGLTYWKPKHQLSFIKNYSDTRRAGRIDAEYYQPKYEDIIKVIKNYSGGWDTMAELVTLKNKNFNPKDKEQYQYIELANIAGNGEVAGCMLEEGQYLPTRARRKVAAGDVIVSSIEGSLSSIALIEKKYNQSLCSTGFHVVNSKQFNSETLLVLLKSIVGQLQLKKGCNGTILTAINNEEFKKIILPKVDEAKQTQIQQKVAESFRLRQQSKELLESAKKAVDIAIEQDEQVAIKWLKNENRKI